MKTFILPQLFAAALLSVSSREAASQDYRDYPGKRVVVVTEGAEFKDRKEVVARGSVGEVYRVEKVQGPWLFVRERSGWIQGKDTVLFDKADDHFTRQIQKDGSARNYYQRGAMRLVLHQLEPAIADFTQVIRLQPTLAAAYGARAGARHDKGELDLALEDYNEVIRLAPKDPIAYHNRAFAWHDKKEFDKAIADCNEAIRLDPKFAAAYNNRGLAWYGKGDYDKAIADYDEAIRLDSGNTIVLGNRASAWMKKGDSQRAIEDYTAAIRLHPHDVMSHVLRGDLFRDSGQYEAALADYRRAIQLNPRAAHPRRSLAWLRATCPDEQFRDGEEAVREAQSACELSQWKDHQAVDTLAAAYAQNGNFEEALRWEHKAIELASAAVPDEYSVRLALYERKEPYRTSAKAK